MQCPNRDGDLIAHTTQGENNLTVSYSTCATCRGHWMDSFAANFIKLAPEEPTTPLKNTPRTYSCPVCQKQLDRSTGENIPEGVFVYQCPEGHGYFFPTGQLAAFKKAQKAKISYHQLWHIPLPSVASVLLGVFLAVVAGGGLFAALGAINQKQTMTSQAARTLVSQTVYIVEEKHAALVTATTREPASLTVHIPSISNLEEALTTTNSLTHMLFIPDVPSGTHNYYFTVTTGGKSTDSELFTFTMPKGL